VAEKPSVLKVPNAALRFRPAGADGGPAGGPPSERGAGGAPPAPRGAGESRGGGGETGGGGGGQRPSLEQIRERLVTGLRLTEEQQKKLDPILQDSRQQMIALRGEQLSEPERQARAQRIREGTRAKIREILTAEQQARYEEMAPGSRGGRGSGSGGGLPGRVWKVGPDGKPKAIPLTLGLSDGTATEVLRGDLAEGQDIIVGSAGPAGQRPGQQSGPRLRL